MHPANADSVQSVIAFNLVGCDVFKQSFELSIQVSRQAQTFEVRGEGDWVSLFHLVEEL